MVLFDRENWFQEHLLGLPKFKLIYLYKDRVKWLKCVDEEIEYSWEGEIALYRQEIDRRNRIERQQE